MDKSSKIKNLYRGKFVFNRESLVKYSYAYSEKQAFLNMCEQIAKKQEILKGIVVNYFSNHQDRYEIKLEVEFKDE